MFHKDTMLVMEWLLSWEVTSWTVAFVVAAAFAFLALDDFRLAKLSFLLAAAHASGGVVMWGIKAKTSPLGHRAIAVFFLVGTIGALTVLAIGYVDKKKHAKESKSITADSEKKEAPKPTPPTNMVTMTNEQFHELMAMVAKQSYGAHPLKSPQLEDSLNADLEYIFYGVDRLHYIYRNPSKHSASQPTIFFGLMDLTNPYVYSALPGRPPEAQPFPVPARVLNRDYVRPGDTQGNKEILQDFAGHIKPGDVIWGIATVTCINCMKRRAYYLYWKVEEGGWYSEADPKDLILPKPEMKPFSDSQINEFVDKLVPLDKREPIKATLES